VELWGDCASVLEKWCPRTPPGPELSNAGSSRPRARPIPLPSADRGTPPSGRPAAKPSPRRPWPEQSWFARPRGCLEDQPRAPASAADMLEHEATTSHPTRPRRVSSAARAMPGAQHAGGMPQVRGRRFSLTARMNDISVQTPPTKNTTALPTNADNTSHCASPTIEIARHGRSRSFRVVQ